MHIISNPMIPYWNVIPNGVNLGTVIQIDGHIPHNSSKFEINLISGHHIGHNTGGDIALQIRFKVHKRKAVCLSRTFGQWTHKQKILNVAALYPGSNVSISIIVEPQYYRILVNGQNICNYSHRVSYTEVRTLNISGHVNVHRIEYNLQTVPNPYPTAMAPPPYTPTVAYTQTAPPPPMYVTPVVPVVQPTSTIVIERGRPHHRPGLVGALAGGLIGGALAASHHRPHHHRGRHH